MDILCGHLDVLVEEKNKKIPVPQETCIFLRKTISKTRVSLKTCKLPSCGELCNYYVFLNKYFFPHCLKPAVLEITLYLSTGELKPDDYNT